MRAPLRRAARAPRRPAARSSRPRTARAWVPIMLMKGRINAHSSLQSDAYSRTEQCSPVPVSRTPPLIRPRSSQVIESNPLAFWLAVPCVLEVRCASLSDGRKLVECGRAVGVRRYRQSRCMRSTIVGVGAPRGPSRCHPTRARASGKTCLARVFGGNRPIRLAASKDGGSVSRRHQRVVRRAIHLEYATPLRACVDVVKAPANG